MYRTATMLRQLGALCAFFTMVTQPGCAPSPSLDSSDVAVSSDLERGILARVGYADGSHVDFLSGSEAGDLAIVAYTRKGRESPVQGIDLAMVLPSDLFAYLTSRKAPRALLDAEHVAGRQPHPDAFASVRASSEEDLVGTSQALSAGVFKAWYCPSWEGTCYTDVVGDMTVSGGRRKRANFRLNVNEGSLRLRIRYNRLIGGDATVHLEEVSADPSFVVEGGAETRAIDRKMWIDVDRAESAQYHLWALFSE